MVIQTNISSNYASRLTKINTNEATNSIEKLASGLAINSAGDDASGLAIAEKMQSQITGIDQGTDNSISGITLVQTADGAMNEVHNILNRMSELCVKSCNGTIADTVDREAIQAEVDVLIAEIDRIAEATNFNGIPIIDGNLSVNGSYDPDFAHDGLILHVCDANATFNKIQINIESCRAEDLGIGELNVSNQEDAGFSNDKIKAAINFISINRADVGAYQNRLERTVNVNSNTSENMNASKSVILDADMAKEMMENTKSNVLIQASQSMLVQSNNFSENVLSLLG